MCIRDSLKALLYAGSQRGWRIRPRAVSLRGSQAVDMTIRRQFDDVSTSCLSRDSSGSREMERRYRDEGRPVRHFTGDRKTPSVPRHDVFDDRKAQTRAPLGAALSRVDAVESFGQSRKMLGRDAAAEVPNA